MWEIAGATMTTKKTVTVDRLLCVLLRDLGIDAENVLRRARLPRDLLTRGQAQPRVAIEEFVMKMATL